MSSVFDEREAYLKNPYFTKHIYGDYTPFYITIAICTILFLLIIVLNIVIGCCSPYTEYWNDRHTGNRWIISLWTATPHNQPALDYKELEDIYIPPLQDYNESEPVAHPIAAPQSKASEYFELQQKRESAI